MRRRFFGVLRGALRTHDGRAILREALGGQLAWRPALPDALDTGRVYPDLGSAEPDDSLMARNAVFVTARFRTGSTLLWDIFRHVPGVTAYYEPLNERRWFDSHRRGTQIDSSHRHVSDYWSEYEGLDELGALYREDWVRRDLYMSATSWDPQLRQYIATLIARARGRALLQFNRVDFRLPWLRATFPTTPIIHLYRHPREQWCSSLINPSHYSLDASSEAFAARDHFYLNDWVRDLKYTFPFLEDHRIAHPYDQFYMIWKLSYMYGRAYADRSISFESLIANPARELSSLLGVLNLRDYDLDQLIELVVPPQQRRWEYAPAEWFAEREAQCEQTLAEFLRPDDATFGSSDLRSHPMLVARGTVSSSSVAETPYH